jgi:hypothetical protein
VTHDAWFASFGVMLCLAAGEVKARLAEKYRRMAISNCLRAASSFMTSIIGVMTPEESVDT